AIKYTDDLFQQFQKEQDLLSSYDTLVIQAHSLIMLGKLSKGETVVKQAETLLEKIKETFTIDLRERESFLVRLKANIYSFKGEIHRSLEFNIRAFELAKDTFNEKLISTSLNNIANAYSLLKEYDKAIFYGREAVKVNYEPGLSVVLATLIDIYISKGDIKEAKVYLGQSRKLTEKFDTKINRTRDLHSEAMILKSSLRARDRIKAEDILKELAMDNTINAESRIDAITDLCDLFLIELRITNDPKIIDEIQPYIQELLDIAEQQHMYLILAQIHFLQAKFSLLTADLKKAKRFLIQAQKIAERFGHKELMERIANEHSKLLKQSDVWKKLKETGAPMTERIKLARLHEQIEELDEKLAIFPAFITEDQVTIHKERKICLICRGEVLRFSYICECGVIYCDNCARAVTDLENVCWVCDVPIDYSKPVKIIKEETESIKDQEKAKKK
ncbi:MAG: tetratricopeptide repeat protein, partial [Candidatus Lokiarchaeota archaeon]|nr:tetratricopeptide repeat protein [Candidatus Lokiarchaeota archaeon]